MATATASTPKTDAAPTGLMASMEVVEKVTLPRRGRGVSEDVIAIRAELVKQLEAKTPTARSFQNIEKDDREVVARKIRAAGALTDRDDKGEIKVSTRYDASNKKLVWGPESVLNQLAG
jgi:hypothetical protein